MNGIYLNLLLREISNKFIGFYIDEIRFKHRVVQIIFGNKALFASLFPEAPALFLSKTTKEQYVKLQPFSNELSSGRIEKIEQTDFMPVVRIRVEKSEMGEKHTLDVIISLYREAPNFSLKTERRQRNLFPRFIEKKPKRSIFALEEKDLRSFLSHKESLVSAVDGVDKHLAQEMTSENILRLRRIVSGERVKPRLVSIVPLRMSLFATDFLNEYTSFNKLFEQGIKQFIAAKTEELRAVQKRELLRKLKRRIIALRKKQLHKEEIEDYRMKGELILTHIAKIERGAQHVRVFNPYSKREVDIKLDPKKTPQVNAQAYFAKYKKSKRGLPKIRDKIKELEEEIKTIESSSFKMAVSTKFAPAQEKGKQQPFRTFKLTSGAVIYVGKNAKSNQELTFSLARPNDYFFHVRGQEGAHVLLRTNVPKGQKPQRGDIKAAAAIATYYSKAKKQKNVAVSYTQRKYLKKDKKGKPGSVLLIREEVIFVEPGLPDKNRE